MKQSVQHIKQRQTVMTNQKKSKAPTVRPRVVRRNSRTSFLNDKWERQANDAAIRIMKGETNVVRFLTPVGAAGKKVTGSRGEPLQPSLRQELENSFGANLEAIRIHRDAVAHSAAQDAGAKAFTSGRTIYFSMGSFDPDCEQGRALLYHELAHTLQQTGRPSKDGRLRVTDAVGQGPIQCIEIDPDNPPAPPSSNGLPSIEYVVYLHTRNINMPDRHNNFNYPSDPQEVVTVFNQYLNSLIPLMPLTPATISLQLHLLEGAPGYIKNIFYDMLKLSQRFEQAASFLSDNTYFSTAFYNDQVVNKLYEQEHRGCFTGAMERTWPANLLWPEAYRNALRNYLRIPTRTESGDFISIDQRLEVLGRDNETPDSLRSRIEERIRARNRLDSNEFAIEGANLVRSTDNFLRGQLENMELILESNPELIGEWHKRQLVAEALAGWEVREAMPTEHHGRIVVEQVENLFREIGHEHQEIIQQQLYEEQRRWQRYIDLDEQTAIESDELCEAWTLIPFRSLVTPMFRSLLGLAADKLRLPRAPRGTGSLPRIIESYRPFLSRALALAADIDQILIMPLMRYAMSEGGTQEMIEATNRLIGWGANMYLTLIQIGNTDLPEENEGAALDMMIGSRMKIIFDMKRLALAWGFEAEAAALNLLLISQDVQTSQLALPYAPQEETNPNLEQLLDDSREPDQGIFEFEPFSIMDIVTFLSWDVQNRLLTNIRNRIGNRIEPEWQTRTGIEDLFLLANAIDDTREETDNLVRYSFTPALYFHYEGDDIEDIRRRILSHHQIMELYSITSILYLPHIPPRDPFIVWRIPRIDDLIFRLRQNHPILNRFLAQDTNLSIQHFQAMNPHDWFQRLRSLAINDQSVSIILEYCFQQNIHQVQVEHEQNRDTLLDAQREATSLDRHIIVNVITELLERYERENRNQFFLRGVLRWMSIFRNNAMPSDEAPLQTAVMVLELSQVLHEKLQGENRFQVNRLVYPILMDTINQVNANRPSNELSPLLSTIIRDDVHSNPEWVSRQVQALVELKDTQVEHLQRVQNELRVFGIGNPGAGRIVSSRNESNPLPAGRIVRQSGVQYEVVRVYRNFTIFMHLGDRAADEAEEGLQGQLLHAQGRVEDETEEDITSQHLHLVTLRVSREGQDPDDATEELREIYSDNYEHVQDLARLVQDFATRELLQEAAMIIGYLAEGTMLAASLHPATSPAVTIVEILRAMNSEEIPQLIEALNNPGLIAQQIDEWFENFDINAMVLYLFLDGGDLPLQGLFNLNARGEETNNERRERRQPDRSMSRSHGSMNRLIRVLQNIGTLSASFFIRLRQSARAGVFEAHRRLVNHRSLRRIIEMLPGVIATASTMRSMASELQNAGEVLMDDRGQPIPLTPEEVVRSLVLDGENLQIQIQETFGAIAEGLCGVEVPMEIVPEGVLEDVILNFVLSRTGARGRAVNRALEACEARQAVANIISRHLVAGTPVDLNIWWQEHFRAPLQTQLDQMQDYLIEGFNQVIRTYFGPTYCIDQSSISSTTLEEDDEAAETEQVEIQPMVRGETIDTEKRINLTTVSGGRPLQPAQRTDLERRFGHDFGHVRLHHGSDADRLTENANAHALTSGSHIYLSHGIALNGNEGQRVLRHELAHVLQQTGARPLGEVWDSSPRSGRPGLGLHHDPVREAAAERMVRKTKSNGEPVTVEEPGEAGLEPDPRQFALRMMNHLAVPQRREDMIDELGRVPVMSGNERQSFRRAENRARALWEELNQRFSSDSGRVTFNRPFQAGRNHIAANLRTLYRDPGRVRDMRVLTYRSVRQLPNGEYRLNPRKFLNELGRYIYARTGIDLTLHARRTGAHAGSLGTVHLTYIHLGINRITSDIWNEVKRITLREDPRAGRLQRKWAVVREIFASLDYNNRVWHLEQFRLGHELVVELADRLESPDEATAEVGDWDQYSNPDFNSNQVGLRVATHGQLRRVFGQIQRRALESSDPEALGVEAPQSGENIQGDAIIGRRSHHIPQHLLVEYFRNQASTNLFDNENERLPGLTSDRGSTIDAFVAGSGTRINLKALDPTSERSANLPAISIAARTHERGQLHVNQSGNWPSSDLEDVSSKPTQGLWIDNFFWSSLRNQIEISPHVTVANDASSKADIAGAIRAIPVADEEARRDGMHRIYSAMARTYRTMRREMTSALGPALEHYEKDYYRRQALARGDSNPHVGNFRRVINAVEALNDRIMHQWRQ